MNPTKNMRLSREDLELQREQKLQASTVAWRRTELYSAGTALTLALSAFTFESALPLEISQSMELGALGAVSVGLYGLGHSSIQRLRAERRRKRLEAVELLLKGGRPSMRDTLERSFG